MLIYFHTLVKYIYNNLEGFFQHNKVNMNLVCKIWSDSLKEGLVDIAVGLFLKAYFWRHINIEGNYISCLLKVLHPPFAYYWDPAMSDSWVMWVESFQWIMWFTKKHLINWFQFISETTLQKMYHEIVWTTLMIVFEAWYLNFVCVFHEKLVVKV